jgi:endonuclease-3
VSLPTVPRSAWKRPAKSRVARIRERLREVYGIPVMVPHGKPVDELILTVLSQSTNDRNRDVAYLRLRERMASWAQVRDAPLEEVEEAIRPGGISKVKSKRIQEILDALGDELDAPAGGTGEPLHWLRDASVPEGQEFLVALPGVGRKTAACVLLFSFGLRDVPADTHVGRVTERLGLMRPGAGSDEQHDAMVALTPPGAELEFHVNLLRHGRRTCHARNPRCGACALRRMCPSRRV